MDRKIIELTARPHLAGLDGIADHCEDREAARKLRDRLLNIVNKLDRRHNFKVKQDRLAIDTK